MKSTFQASLNSVENFLGKSLHFCPCSLVYLLSITDKCRKTLVFTKPLKTKSGKIKSRDLAG